MYGGQATAKRILIITPGSLVKVGESNIFSSFDPSVNSHSANESSKLAINRSFVFLNAELGCGIS